MRSTPTAWLLLATASVGLTASAVGDDGRKQNWIVLEHCPIEYGLTTELGGNHAMGGTIKELSVREGDRVKRGQVVGQLYNRDAEAALKTSEAQLKTAALTLTRRQAELEIEKLKLARLDRLRARNTLLTSIQDYQVQELGVKVADLERQAAVRSLELAEATTEQARAMLSMRDFVASHDGVVVKIHKHPGETVSLADPILRIVEIDLLRVTGFVNVNDAWNVHPGNAVRVMPDLGDVGHPIEREVFTGKVTFVDSEVDVRTRTVRVFAEIKNRSNFLRAGLECRMEVAADDIAGPDPAKAPGDRAAVRTSAVEK